jgi:hypothetical protein
MRLGHLVPDFAVFTDTVFIEPNVRDGCVKDAPGTNLEFGLGHMNRFRLSTRTSRCLSFDNHLNELHVKEVGGIYSPARVEAGEWGDQRDNLQPHQLKKY